MSDHDSHRSDGEPLTIEAIIEAARRIRVRTDQLDAELEEELEMWQTESLASWELVDRFLDDIA